jgi:hypothetical protein
VFESLGAVGRCRAGLLYHSRSKFQLFRPAVEVPDFFALLARAELVDWLVLLAGVDVALAVV